MKKRLYILLFITTALAACLFGNTSCTKKVESKSTIKFWHFWSEPSQKKALMELVKKFESENNCKVEVTELSWNDGKTKLIAAFNSGTAPDVLELGSDWVAQFSSTNVLTELNPAELNGDRWVEFSKEAAMWKGKCYAAPWVVDTRVIFFNKTLFRNAGLEPVAPTTYAATIQAAEKIQNGDVSYGFGVNGSDPHRLYKKITSMFWSYGGGLLDNAGNPCVNSSQNVEALQAYLALSRVGMLETQKQIDAAFVQGKVGIWMSGAWLIDKIKNENPNLDYGVALVPGKDDSKPGVSFAGGEYLALSAKNKKLDSAGIKRLETAKKFLKFMVDGANSLEFCKKVNEAGFPADTKYFADSLFMKNPIKSVFANQLKSAKSTPVHPRWLDIESILEEAVVQALYGRMDAKSALDAAQYQISALLKD